MLDTPLYFKKPEAIYGIFFLVLIASLHRRIRNVQIKKWSSTLLGLACIYGADGSPYHFICVVICFLIQCILLQINKKWVHLTPIYSLISFTAYRSIAGDSIYIKYMYTEAFLMHLTARIIGLSCDISRTYKLKTSKESHHWLKFDDYHTEPTFIDAFHYVFGFIGLGVGTFYRFRTFDDYMNNKTPVKIDEFHIMMKFLAFATILHYYLPYHISYGSLEAAMSDDFSSKSAAYKMAYFMFLGYILMITLIILDTLFRFQCELSGFAAYPKKYASKSGHGPTLNYNSDLSTSVCTEYDFQTIRGFDFDIILFTPWIGKLMKHWNKCNQYWIVNLSNLYLAQNYHNYALRLLLTFLISLAWHGFHLGTLLVVIFIMNAIVAMKYYSRIYALIKDNKMISWVYLSAMYFMRMFIKGNAMIFGLLNDWNEILIFMKDLYYLPVLMQILFFLLGWILNKLIKLNNFNTKPVE